MPERPVTSQGKRLLMIAVLLIASYATCDANDETIRRKIDQEVQTVNLQLSKGRAFQLNPKCDEYTFCEFETAFVDRQGYIRKIVEWSEGAVEDIDDSEREPPLSESSARIRSIWEWYYDAEGQPIFVGGRYEGRPGSGWVQEHTCYIEGGREIGGFTADGRIAPFRA